MIKKERIILIIAVIYFSTFFFIGLNYSPEFSKNFREIDTLTSFLKDSFLVGEKLTYEVSWSFIKLGTIKTLFLRKVGDGDSLKYYAACYIDSYPEIIVANLHAVYETIMKHDCSSEVFTSREKDGEGWNFVNYYFKRESNKVVIEKSVSTSETGDKGTIKKSDTINVNDNCLDGLSLLYFARANVASGKRINMPTMIEGKQGFAEFNFYNKKTSAKIKAVDYPVDVIEFNGNAKFEGIFGLSGPFKGWFSNDNAHIPIIGKLKVILGSVSVELIEWERAGWNPPMYKRK